MSETLAKVAKAFRDNEAKDALGWSAGEMRGLIRAVDYAMTGMDSAAGIAERQAARRRLTEALTNMTTAVNGMAVRNSGIAGEVKQMATWAANKLAMNPPSADAKTAPRPRGIGFPANDAAAFLDAWLDEDGAGAEYSAIRRRAEKRGLEATVTGSGVKVFNGKTTKTIKTMAELEAFMGQRQARDANSVLPYMGNGDAPGSVDDDDDASVIAAFIAEAAAPGAVTLDDDPCWEGFEQAGTKTKNGETVPNCIPTNDGWTARVVVTDGVKSGSKNIVDSMEMDLGRQGWGEVEFVVNVGYQATVDYRSLASVDWQDAAGAAVPRSQAPIAAIEARVRREIDKRSGEYLAKVGAR